MCKREIQLSEFVITGKGRVLSSTCSSSPIGPIDPAETLALLQILAARKAS